MTGSNGSDDRPADGRFSREPAATRGDAETTTAAPPEATTAAPHETTAAAPRDTTERPATEEPHSTPSAHEASGTVGADQMRAIRARQRDEFGGFAWGSAFFGWLVAFGVAVLLSGLLAAAGAATGLTQDADESTIGLAGGIALLVAVSVAYFCGGYVAGRLARFDGARNGFGVWVIGLLVTLALGALAVAAGSEYNVLDRANLPRLTVGDETATTEGILTMVGMLALTALAAALGGKAGERYHSRVDRHAVA